MYRLFQRAQTLLADRDSQQAAGGIPLRSASPDAEPRQVTEQLLNESQQVGNLTMTAPELPVGDPVMPFLAGFSPQFSDVDQLLSPGFALSEDVFFDFCPDYQVM